MAKLHIPDGGFWMKATWKRLAVVLGAFGVCLAAGGAHASLIVNGITYTLTESTTADPLTDRFTLDITGINGAADDEGGRSGVDGIAFNPPANFASAVMIDPASWVFKDGGLNSGGCNGNGNFFCFDNPASVPTSPALAAGSSLTFIFDVTLSSGTFANYAPDFKINWIGSQNNYDLVSQVLTPTASSSSGPSSSSGTSSSSGPLPEPGTLLLLASGAIAAGLMRRRAARTA